jgi:hypothetical protein
MENMPVYYPLLFFIVLWIVLMNIISRIGGWSQLARHYREASPHEGSKFRFQSASMRWMMGYNNCLTFGPGRDGLHISVPFPLKIAHPPLAIPWSEISSSAHRGRFFGGYRLHFARCPEVPFIITKKLMGKITNALGATQVIPERH